MLQSLVGLYLFFALLPWVSFGLIDAGIQPYSFILGVVVNLLLYRGSMPAYILWSCLLAFTCLLVTLAYFKFSFLSARAVVTYSSLPVHAMAFYLIKKHKIFNVSVSIYSANVVWLCAGVFQKIVGTYSLVFLVTARTSESRGVTSLAPEPTFYGMFLILITWLIWAENQYLINKLVVFFTALNIIGVLFFAQSSMAVLYLILLSFIVVLFNIKSIARFAFTMMASTVVAAVLYFSVQSMEGSRVKNLLGRAVDEGVEVARHDESINDRLRSIVFPLAGAMDNNLLPSGFHLFESVSAGLRRDFGGFFYSGRDNNKIMSGVGSAVFELGFGSLFLFMAIFSASKRRGMRALLAQSTAYIAILSSALTLGIPLFGMLLTSIAYAKEQEPEKKEVLRGGL